MFVVLSLLLLITFLTTCDSIVKVSISTVLIRVRLVIDDAIS